MTVIKALAIAALVSGCVADNEASPVEPATDMQPQADLMPAQAARPQTCADIAKANPTAGDDVYTLFVGGDESMSWTAYCADMTRQPVEYLPLVFVQDGHNASTFVDRGGAAGGTAPGLTTSYLRVRIDPSSLVVDIGDQRFAETIGDSPSGFQSMPYGVAASCDGTASGRANIDLRGTEFTIAATFTTNLGTGSVSVDPTNQVVDLTGGGACEWTGPATALVAPFNGAHSWTLALAYKL